MRSDGEREEAADRRRTWRQWTCWGGGHEGEEKVEESKRSVVWFTGMLCKARVQRLKRYRIITTSTTIILIIIIINKAARGAVQASRSDE